MKAGRGEARAGCAGLRLFPQPCAPPHRLRRGRQPKAEQGGCAWGAPPLGYRAEGGELAPDPEEQAAVQRIVALRADGAGVRRIAATLTAEHLTPKRSGWLHPQQVARVLDRAGVNQHRVVYSAVSPSDTTPPRPSAAVRWR